VAALVPSVGSLSNLKVDFTWFEGVVSARVLSARGNKQRAHNGRDRKPELGRRRLFFKRRESGGNLMTDSRPALPHMMLAALAPLVVTTIVSMQVPASAGSYESCLGSCAMGSNRDSPGCIDRSVKCLTPGPSSSQSGSIGAIAYSITANKSGHSYGYPTQREAERRAVSECLKASNRANDCKPYVWFDNRCGAIASGDDDVVQVGVGRNESAAVNAALSSCERNNGANCEKITSYCSLR